MIADIKPMLPLVSPVPVAIAASVVQPLVTPEILDIKQEPEPIVTGLPSVFDPLPESPKDEKPILPLHQDGESIKWELM